MKYIAIWNYSLFWFPSLFAEVTFLNNSYPWIQKSPFRSKLGWSQGFSHLNSFNPFWSHLMWKGAVRRCQGSQQILNQLPFHYCFFCLRNLRYGHFGMLGCRQICSVLKGAMNPKRLIYIDLDYGHWVIF